MEDEVFLIVEQILNDCRSFFISEGLYDEFQREISQLNKKNEVQNWCVKQIQNNTKFASLAYDYLKKLVWGMVISRVKSYVYRMGLSYIPQEIMDKAEEIFDTALTKFDPDKGVLFTTFLFGELQALQREVQYSKEKETRVVALDRPVEGTTDIVIADVLGSEEDFEKFFGGKSGLMQKIYRYIRVLPPRQQEVIKLRSQGLTFDEIGDELGVRRSTAYELYKSGITELRKRFKVKELLPIESVARVGKMLNELIRLL